MSPLIIQTGQRSELFAENISINEICHNAVGKIVELDFESMLLIENPQKDLKSKHISEKRL